MLRSRAPLRKLALFLVAAGVVLTAGVLVHAQGAPDAAAPTPAVETPDQAVEPPAEPVAPPTDPQYTPVPQQGPGGGMSCGEQYGCCLNDWQGGGVCDPGEKLASCCDAGCVNCGTFVCVPDTTLCFE